MEQQIKISAYITLDNEKEKDLIDTIESLKDNRQLSNFVTNIVKFSLENPLILEQAHIDSSKVLMANSRLKFFEEVKQSLIDMDNKIESIKDLSTKTYELSRLGKKIGLEEKARNELRTQLVLKRHMNELKRSLGYSEYEFNRRMSKEESELQTYEDKAEEFLEYVIEHYDGIIQELVEDNRVREVTYESKETVKLENHNTVEYNTGKAEDSSITEKKTDDEIKAKEAEVDKPVELKLDIASLEDFFS